MNLHYHIVDVFTDRAFGGNPLAVFPDGQDLSTGLMQSIAQEFNLSETTFVLPPDDPRNDFHVRIFTPTIEMPMAGHPTLGTAYVLARERKISPWDHTTTLRFEEGVGVIPVALNGTHGHPEFIEMIQPLPEFGRAIDDVSAIAEMLSLDGENIRSTELPVEVVSCGVPFLFVPVIDLAAIRRIRFRLDVWERVRDQIQTPNVFVFTREVERAGSQVHSRMFAPGLGVVEDPATGSASGPLGCYLVRHQVLPSDGELRCVSEQGLEMGRPSFISIRIRHRNDQISEVAVGGSCHYMGAGRLDAEGITATR